ncbi:MAG TPA: DUF3011 domain-containing protein [Candidatus Acidoferrales bacterium]|nr:DUF3011 domain-containing protein [Candidatus Acidoferrales bacterium]
MNVRNLLIMLLAAMLFPAMASAQQRLTCTSGPHGQRTYCAADTRGGVALVRVRSHRPCREGVSWGFDAQGIWVEGGCDADFEVRPYAGGPWWWYSGKGHRPEAWQGTGACFFTDSGYGGRYFCMSRGEAIRHMPPGFDNRISSIQLVRANSVLIFSKDDFGGYSGRISEDVPMLKNWRIPGTDKSWNNRISSIRVE